MIRSFVYVFLLLSASCYAQKAPQSTLLQDVKELSSDKYEGRKTGSKGNKLAAEYIRARLEAMQIGPYGPAYFHYFRSKARGSSISGRNVLAFVPGKSKEQIVISAHYDHLGVIKGQIYNGADDDASGVAALLYLADHYRKNKPEHSLVFAFFDGEETGLLGAQAFADSLARSGTPPELNVNLDMISHNDKNELYVCGTGHYPFLEKYLITTVPDLKLLKGHDKGDPQEDWTMQGDHGAFHRNHIPFLYFGVEDHKDYHQATDDYENINQAFFLKAVEAIKQVISNYDSGKTLQKGFNRRKLM